MNDCPGPFHSQSPFLFRGDFTPSIFLNTSTYIYIYGTMIPFTTRLFALIYSRSYVYSLL